MTNEVILNGNQAWMISTENGQTRVVHTTGTTWNDPLQAPVPQTSVGDLLRQYASRKGCMGATLGGQTSVAGRPTYVIDLQFRPNSCPSAGPTPAPDNPKAALGGKPAAGQDSQVDHMTVWVDSQTYLPLKTEVRNAANALLDRSEVTSVNYNVTIPDSTFTYETPAGAVVSNFTGGTGADVKQALSGSPPVPPSKQQAVKGQ